MFGVRNIQWDISKHMISFESNQESFIDSVISFLFLRRAVMFLSSSKLTTSNSSDLRKWGRKKSK